MNDADHNGPPSDAGRRQGGPHPPRPAGPPSSGGNVSASRGPYPRWNESQATPRDNAAHDAGAGTAAGTAANADPGAGYGGNAGTSGGSTGGQGGKRRTVGIGALIIGMLLAGLAGGGVAAAVNAASDPAGGTAQQSAGTVQEQNHGLEINRSEDATLVTAAAAKAGPSVVTLSVTDGQAVGSGSGVILDDQGHILTNTHVVTLGGASGSTNVTVQTTDGTVHSATVVGTDPQSDLAVVKIEAEGLTPVEFGQSSELNVGDTAIAIGAPLGLSGTVTDGIVSKLNRTISVASSAAPEDSGEGDTGGAPEFEIPGFPEAPQQPQGAIFINVIQTDAAINPGNSGGALVDADGRLIGINVAIASAAGGADAAAGNIGVGFSIPVDYAQRVAQDLIEEGEATHGYLGVSVTPQPAVPEDVDDAQAADLTAGQTVLASGGFSAGARVVTVEPGSPAAQAGLREGDVITGVGENPVADSQSLTATVREYPEGGTATVHFTRDGEQQSTEVTFAAGAGRQ